MSRLIRANFARLFKSGIFRLYVAFSCGLGVFCVLMRYFDYQRNMEHYSKLPLEYHTIDGIAFIGMMYLLFAIPVFIGLFLGTEYSDGTIRNKLVVGHKRSAIYFSNLIVCTAGTLIGAGCNLLINFTLGSALCGLDVLKANDIIKTTLYIFIALLSATAIMVLISMVVNSKAGASVSVIIITMIMFFSTLTIFSRLEAPEYYEGYSYVDTETGVTIEIPAEKNPSYLEGTKRKVYQAVYDVMPTSHIYEYAMMFTEKANKYSGYDGIILIATTIFGIILFRKKDLK
ncbi:MAG: ABC transporter permease [Oscillospiraceae bacterium]|nr:ABC transporter permease [Oscillospiraceae bacterium]